jgi:uncharacterized protein DUF6458
MGIGVSLVIIAVGAILAFAVHPTGNPPVDPNAAGWILLVVGLVALMLDVILWESWGPAYLRRRRMVYDGGYPARSAPRTRRTVVEDEFLDAGPPPP